MEIRTITREEIINRILDRLNEGETLSDETRTLLIELSQSNQDNDNG
jgi:ribosome assembly protein YihI (activator of Der GTPase)